LRYYAALQKRYNNRNSYLNNTGFHTYVEAFDAGECIGYVNGLNNMMQMRAIADTKIKNFDDPEFHKKYSKYALYCMPDNVKNIQTVRIIVNYLNNHPKKLNESPFLIVTLAFKQAFPCSKA
jgi:hypothetical protein